ncbi:MAG TPA: hypothetical protein VFB05_25350, partial [Bradyrhizobium sp.]|nr:hypothetical protein [Bradyrhizobium sp.]
MTVDLSITGSQDTVGAGFDTLNGDFANLTGSTFNDLLTGNGNDNVIVGCSGMDTINAGSGNDTLVVDTGDAVAGETYNGGVGTDTLQLTDTADFTGSSLLSIEKLLFSTFSASTATFTSGQLGGANLSVILTVTGDANADHIVVNMT